MKCEMVEEMAVVNRLIDLYVVLTHILPEASSIEVSLRHFTVSEAKNANVAARDGSQSQPSRGEGIYCRGRRFGA